MSWQPEGVDPYKVLGLKRGDSLDPASLKKAYRQAALRWHPDKVQQSERQEAEKRFIEIAWAYEVLGDPAKRTAFEQAPPKDAGAGRGSESSSRPKDFSMEKAAKVFKDVFGDTSKEYQDLITHLVASSATGSKDQWKKHAADIAKALQKSNGKHFSVETKSADGSELMKTHQTVEDDGRGTVKKTVVTSHKQVTSSSGPHALEHGSGNPALDAHKAHMAAHEAAVKAAQEAARKANSGSRHKLDL